MQSAVGFCGYGSWYLRVGRRLRRVCIIRRNFWHGGFTARFEGFFPRFKNLRAARTALGVMRLKNSSAEAAIQPTVKKPNAFVRFIQQWDLQLLVLPGIILLFIFSYVPIYGIIMAFQDFKLGDTLGMSEWVGLKWFKQLFTSPDLFGIVRNTLVISLLKLTIGFICPIIFAVFLNELRVAPVKKTVQTLSYLPHFISWTVTATLLFDLLGSEGALTQLLVNLHILKQPVNFFQKGEWFWGLATISNIWKELGWDAIIYVSAIAGIDVEMYEAADIDGATRLQKMWHITVKSIKPTIILLLIMNVGGVLNANFDQIMMLTRQMTNAALTPYAQVIDTYSYRMGIALMRFSYGTAVGLIKSIINFFLLLTANKIADKAGETALL